MSTDIIGALGAGAGRIGRYFTVVSAVPAAVFAAYVYALVRVQPWSPRLRWEALTHIHLADLPLLGIGALVLALALHPLQFALIQWFEGYWGGNALARELAVIRTMHHRRRHQDLEAEELDLTRRVPHVGDRRVAGIDASIDTVRAATGAAERRRARASYPVGIEYVLPTRLGNVMRRYETAVGKPYGINPLLAVPRLAVVAGDRELRYVENQRVQMELAIRTAFLALAAAVLTAALMAQHGGWVLLALAPYAVGYLAYRGSVALAHEYGTSLAVLVEMSRFDLYRRLHLQLPETIARERTRNAILMRLFAFESPPRLHYGHTAAEPDQHAAEPDDGSGGQASTSEE